MEEQGAPMEEQGAPMEEQGAPAERHPADLPVASRKASMRDEMKRHRRAIPAATRREREPLLAANLMALPEIEAARRVLIYASFAHEAPTGAAMEALHAAGKSVLLPYLDGGTMEAAPHMPDSTLVPSTYGPAEPADQQPVDPSIIDVVVTPGLAFDPTGARLGYGGGFYDRFLQRVSPHTITIGLAFAEQIVESVPTDSHDIRLAIVVTDKGVMRCHQAP